MHFPEEFFLQRVFSEEVFLKRGFFLSSLFSSKLSVITGF